MKDPTPLLLLLLSMNISFFASANPIRGGYYPSWRAATFPVTSVDTSYFTHVLYAFINPSSTTFQLNVTADDAPVLSNFASSLQSSNPPAKALISIAGNRDTIASIAANPTNRRIFIRSTITTARKYSLHGLDLDYEFPRTQKEISDLAQLLQDWRLEINKEARRSGKPTLLLTAAVYFASSFFLSNKNQYPIASINAHLDWINVMCYDYHGSWDTSRTGLHAALYDPQSNISTSYGLQSWINAGVPAKKLVMGLPVYGRSWKLKNATENGVGAPAVGVGPGESDGTMVYSKVVEFNKGNGAVEVFDEEKVGAYSFAGTAWIGYDNPASATAKVEYAKDHGLGGYFFWAIGYDNDWAITSKVYDSWKI